MNFPEKVTSKTAKVGILGLGYVGIPLALRVHEVGLPVLGFDIDCAALTAQCRAKPDQTHLR